jgi:Mg/Co/Ni transporter MgtE
LEGDGRVIGLVSEADLLPKEEFRNSDPDQLGRLSDLAKAGAVTATEPMSSPAVTVHGDATLAQAARIMAQRQVKRLPVIDNEDMLKGIVSRADLLKVLLPSDEDIAEEIRHEVVAYVSEQQQAAATRRAARQGRVPRTLLSPGLRARPPEGRMPRWQV